MHGGQFVGDIRRKVGCGGKDSLQTGCGNLFNRAMRQIRCALEPSKKRFGKLNRYCRGAHQIAPRNPACWSPENRPKSNVCQTDAIQKWKAMSDEGERGSADCCREDSSQRKVPSRNTQGCLFFWLICVSTSTRMRCKTSKPVM